MRRISVLGVVVVAALALLAIGCDSGDTVVNTTPGSEGISVSGTGSAFGKPDLATLTLGVQVNADTVAAARESAAEALAGVIESAKSNGVDEKDIQTVQFSIYPRYSSGDRPVLRDYQVNNVISIKVRNFDDAPKIIDDAVAAGGDNTVVQGISFSIEDPTALEKQAREAAVKDAKARAEQLADLADVHLGKPQMISESGGYTPVFYAGERALAAGAADAATPIQGGQLEVQISVSLLYHIE